MQQLVHASYLSRTAHVRCCMLTLPRGVCVVCTLLQAKHHPDLVMCMKQPGIGECCVLWAQEQTPHRQAAAASCRSPALARATSADACQLCLRSPPAARHMPPAAIGRLCEKCDGKCPICDSYVRPATLVRVCDECNYGSYEGRCVICGGVGVSDAYYCKECTLQEKDVSGRAAGCRLM